ncbi:MAG: amidase family protein [Pseudomonadales bacterium]
MTFAEYSQYDGCGLAELIRNKDVSIKEVAETAIEKIEAINPRLNAVVWPMYDMARKSLDHLPDGPFKGVPFLVKDLNLAWANTRLTSGSRYLKDYYVDHDAPLTTAFKQSGVVALGKTNTPEFGITGTTEPALFGACRNPWNTDHITGGSSGGSAAAVAAGLVPMAHASDGAGSIRIPAACCGLVGLKPSRGRTCSPGAHGDVFHSYSHHYIVSRTVRDTAAMLDCVSDASPYAPSAPGHPFKDRQDPGRLTVHFSDVTASGRKIDARISDALNDTANLLLSLGHDVTERPLALDLKHFYRHFGVVGASQLAADIEEFAEVLGRPPKDHELEPLSKRNIEAGKMRSGARVIQALREVRLFTRKMEEEFQNIDVYLMPVLGTPVPKIGYLDPNKLDPREQDKRSAEVFPYTPPFNATGQPAISLPLFEDDNGLPVGMQFIAKYADESTLLSLAWQLEEALPWSGRRPPVFA